ncbi:MAG: VTT domain-containing protein [Pirellulales bacterium]
MDWFHWLVDQVLWLIRLADPQRLGELLQQIGPVWVYAVLFAIIFSETGLLVGFFLPGDSLLFAAGLLSSQPEVGISIVVLNVGLMVAAVVGDAINYSLGKQMGARVFEKGRLRFVKHDHLMAAKAFYERHGGKAIVLARFVPLVRTFTPFVAGVARMRYRDFVFYNIAGGVGWVFSMTMIGYLLGNVPFISEHFEKVVLLIVFISILPILIGGFRHWSINRARAPHRTTTDDEAEVSEKVTLS